MIKRLAFAKVGYLVLMSSQLSRKWCEKVSERIGKVTYDQYLECYWTKLNQTRAVGTVHICCNYVIISYYQLPPYEN